MAAVSGQTTIIVEWVLIALAFAFVATRMGLRLVNQQKNLLASDILLLISAALALGLGIGDTMTYKLGGMGSEEVDDPSINIKLGKIAFSGNYFYDTGIYFPKFSILALYTRLIPISMPRLRLALWIIFGFVAVSCLTTFLADTLWCGANVASNWSLVDGACSSFNSVPLFHMDWSLNFISDMFIFVLPFPMFRNLTLQRRQLYGLIFTFGLGLITIAVNLSRFATISLSNNFNSIYVWSMAEMCVSIIVACLPALRPLLRRRGEGSSTDPSTGSRRITRIFDSVLSKTGLSTLKSSHRLDKGNAPRHGKNTDRMQRLSDDGDSRVELTTASKFPGIYKSQDISVQRTGLTEGSSNDLEAGAHISLGNDSKAWHV